MLTSYQLGLLSEMGIHVILALSVYVILSTGQLSLGNAGFMAIGAYTASVLTVNLGWPLTPALLAAGILSGLIGLLVGFPALRLSGIYLAMVTLGFGQIVSAFFLVFAYTGAERGFFGMLPVDHVTIWVWTLVLIGMTFLLERSRAWLGVRAVEDDEFVAQVMGLNITVVKLSAFSYGAAIAGIAGGLFAHFAVYIEPQTFTFMDSVEMVLYVILGGSETIWGAIFGAMALTMLPEWIRFMADWRDAFYGLLLILMLTFRPRGIITRDLMRKVHTLGSRLYKKVVR